MRGLKTASTGDGRPVVTSRNKLGQNLNMGKDSFNPGSLNMSCRVGIFRSSRSQPLCTIRS
eukprot:227096-Amorphochlora_amoeboformis.AAC.2